jgi:hypothetical protein
MVGGGSLLFLLFTALFLTHSEQLLITWGAISLLLANFINHPHFAHSYQILYSNFYKKLFSQEYEKHMRIRYWWTGVFVPLIIILFFVVSLLSNNPKILGFGANAMFFLVGWHYIKQGYGILIVLSVKQKIFLNNLEKNTLRYNGYILWLFSWVMANNVVSEKKYLGLDYYTLPFPDIMVTIGYVIGAFSTITCLYIFYKRHKRGDRLPAFNGIVAYITSAYIWIFVRWIDPAAALMIPAFHSLQYLPFVWRYKYNQYIQEAETEQQQKKRGALSIKQDAILMMSLFITIAAVLGFLGFHLLPMFMDTLIFYDKTLFGITMFVFMWWVFINVHHYFIDNTIWRKENKDVQQFLFAD